MSSQQSTVYYDSLKGMLLKYDKYSRKSRFLGKGLEDFQKWKINSKNILCNLLGLSLMDRTELNPQMLESGPYTDGISFEKILLETEPDIYMPVLILIPKTTPKGVFLAMSGHRGVGKESVAGHHVNSTVDGAIEFYNYDYGYQLVKLGYVVACPETRGFGERRDAAAQGDTPEKLLSCSCFQLAHMAEGMGETVAGMQVWDNMRLIDYLERRAEWSLDNLGSIGFSGGGMQTLWLSAMDARVKQVYISGYFYGARDSFMLLNGNCSCNYVPGLWRHFDLGDIASIIAPKPMVIQTCSEDALNGPRGLKNVEEQLQILRKAYSFYNAEDRLIHEIFPGQHHMHTDNLEKLTNQFDSILRKM
ncbi:dienelactone hydrolase family protein [Treponema parvum]|uniref:dienelactone hydrolase family protein n=1 Tax=Treponema parvum TaxID=138851 RepID=UPI001AEBD520|nr:alpha/beta hydrolase family protein [Treponema parvum]